MAPKKPHKVNKKTKLKLDIPKGFDSKDKREIAFRVMDFIVERTSEGKGVNHRVWGPSNGGGSDSNKYSPEYAEQKGQKKPIDLINEDNMLIAMQYFKSIGKKNEIVIGYRSGSREEKKAEGNILGTYGRPKGKDYGKARPFLDILDKDLNKIIADYVKEKNKKDKDKEPELEKTEDPNLIFRR